MQINVSFDQDITRLPAGFVAGVVAGVRFLENTYTNPITFNLHVGYGERDGTALSAQSLGESAFGVHSYSYAQIETALTSHGLTADQRVAYATLPATDPVAGNHTWWMADVEAKALGLIANSTTINEYVGFADTNHFTFDYNRADGISAGQYDFFGTVVHEITEVMGRELGVGQQLVNGTNTYYPLDLFHYVADPPRLLEASATSGMGATGSPSPETYSTSLIAGLKPGLLSDLGIHPWEVRDFSRGGYFSIDGGITNLGDFNSLSSGDAGDWAPNVGSDSFLNVSLPGVIDNVTANDLTLMDILGYDRAPVYHIPIAGIVNEFIG
jgi:hypothetical protein